MRQMNLCESLLIFAFYLYMNRERMVNQRGGSPPTSNETNESLSIFIDL
jgi:hypothetical protein